jgi:hypothetical protein
MSSRIVDAVWAACLPAPLRCVGCGIEMKPFRAMGLPDGAVACRIDCGMRYWRWAHESRGKLGPSQHWPHRAGKVET